MARTESIMSTPSTLPPSYEAAWNGTDGKRTLDKAPKAPKEPKEPKFPTYHENYYDERAALNQYEPHQLPQQEYGSIPCETCQHKKNKHCFSGGNSFCPATFVLSLVFCPILLVVKAVQGCKPCKKAHAHNGWNDQRGRCGRGRCGKRRGFGC